MGTEVSILSDLHILLLCLGFVKSASHSNHTVMNFTMGRFYMNCVLSETVTVNCRCLSSLALCWYKYKTSRPLSHKSFSFFTDGAFSKLCILLVCADFYYFFNQRVVHIMWYALCKKYWATSWKTSPPLQWESAGAVRWLASICDTAKIHSMFCINCRQTSMQCILCTIL